MTSPSPLGWTTRRDRVALALVLVALFAALLEAVADEIAQPWWAQHLTLGEAFLRLLQPWLLVAFLALAVRELVIPRWLVAGSRWLTALLHALGAALFPLIHLYLLAVVQTLVFPAERSGVLQTFVGLVPTYYVQGVALYSAIAAAFYAVDFARTAGERERLAFELKASLSEARLAALHHQLSPHFLFNALNTVAMLIRQGRSDDALSMLAEFGGLMRDLLRDSPDHEVTLQEELEFVRRYLAVERVRFADRLEVRIDATAPGTLRVPSLILQPLVENAVRHGVAKHAASGRIAVTARRDGGMLELSVEDNGPGLSTDAPKRESGGVGLANVRARLAQLYGDAAQLTLTGGASGGVTATMRLPLKSRDQLS
jgi:LytS/YehU family sensor histidine kinase